MAGVCVHTGRIASNIPIAHKCPLDWGVQTAFGLMLKRLIVARYESLRAFVRAAQPDAQEESASSYLSKAISGARPASLDLAEIWARALKITGREKELFMDLAAIAHLPGVVQPRFIELIDKIALIETRQNAVEARRQRNEK